MHTEVTVREAMDREFVGVSEGDPAPETAELLVAEGAGCAVVVRGGAAVGLLCESDLLAALVERGTLEGASAEAVMRTPVPTIDADADLSAAAESLAAGDTRRLVAVEGGEPVGVLSEHDLVTAGAFAPGRGADDPEPRSAAPAQDAVGRTGERTALGDGEGARSTQSVCEACGALSRGLVSVQGQSLCPDCRDV